MRILVLRGGALGDFIVTLPALRRLRARWPQARIELAGNVTAAGLGIAAGVLAAVHSQHEARWAQLYAGDTPLAPDFAAWLDGFDTVISFWPDPEGELRRHFAHRGGAFVASGAQVDCAPAARYFYEALTPLGWPDAEGGADARDYHAKLTFPATAHAEAARRLHGLGPFVAMHPGSGSPRKNWPLACWRELLVDTKEPILAVLGPADEAVRTAFAGRGQVLLADNWPLPVLGAALSRARVFVGHDTGIAHLAAGAGARCLLLFGPTDPAVWAPPGDHVTVLRDGPDLSAISVETVQALLTAPTRPPAS